MGVGADPENDTPPFSYSIGLTLKSWHELFVEAIPHDLGHYLINYIAKRFDEQKISLDHSCILTGVIQNGLPIALVEANLQEVKNERTIQVDYIINRSNYSVLQIVLPDENGLFPWEDGCSEKMRYQVIYREESGSLSLFKLMEDAPHYNLQKQSVH